MEINQEMATFYGILAGDGCLSQSAGKKFISITCNFHDDKDFFNLVVSPLIKSLLRKEIKYRNRKDQGKIEFNFVDSDLLEFLKSLKFPVGKKGKNIEIPQKLNIFMRFVISGYFATDGSLVLANNNGIVYPRIEIQSLYNKILYQTKKYLESNGMKGGIYRFERKGFQKIFRLQFNGFENLMIFSNAIGFLNPKHRVKFEKYLNGRSSSAVERHTTV